MIWGHDYSARLFVDLAILIVILSVHFIKLYLQKRKAQQNKSGPPKDRPEQ